MGARLGSRMRLRPKQWVRSARVRHKGRFVAQVIEAIGRGEYIVRDRHKVKWLRHASQLNPVPKPS